MEYTKLLLSQEGPVGIITLNDPANRNTITGPIGAELFDALINYQNNNEIRAVLIRAEGPAFSAGANIGTMKERSDNKDYSNTIPSMDTLGRVMRKIRSMRKPVICALRGAVAGAGVSIALHADFRIASENCKITMPFTNIGLVPDCGGIIPLINLVGVGRANEMIMACKLIDGKKAAEWGLVTEAVPDEEVEARAMKLATKLANGTTLAYGEYKNMVNRIVYPHFEWQLEEETHAQLRMLRSHDHREGIYAFLEKRKPEFKGE